MKEATGELNMTVITVVAIAAVAAFFYAFVWPAIQNTIERNTKCAAAYDCHQLPGQDMMQCLYDEDGDGQNAEEITCPLQDNTDDGD